MDIEAKPMRHLIWFAPALALSVAMAAPAAAQHRSHERDARAERLIELLDTDGDGRVSLAEIMAEHERLFAAADLDGDGTLSVDEFRRRGRLFQSLGTTTLFDMLDANGDQMLSADEINRPSQRWFGRYDSDGDGTMTADEITPDDRSGPRRRR